MRLPRFGWIITCDSCDEQVSPHELFYFDKDWAIEDAKERNEDHTGHKVVAAKVLRAEIIYPKSFKPEMEADVF